MTFDELRRIDVERQIEGLRAELRAAKAQLEREIPSFMGFTETSEEMDARYGYGRVAEQVETTVRRSGYLERIARLLGLRPQSRQRLP